MYLRNALEQARAAQQATQQRRQREPRSEWEAGQALQARALAPLESDTGAPRTARTFAFTIDWDSNRG